MSFGKKISAAVTAAAAALTLSANICSAQGFSSEFDMYDFISESDCIVLASYENMTGGEYRFRIIRTLKNDMPETYFYLTAEESFGKELEEGGRYVLFLDRDISVYYPHDRYTPINDVLMTADEKNAVSSMTIDGIPVENPPESVSSLKRYISEVPDTSESERDYIRSSKPEEIVRLSDIAVSVTVGKRISDGGDGCGVYRCTVKECFKGNVAEEIEVMLFDSKVKTGESCYLLLNKDGDKLVLSSKKSIYKSSDKDLAKALKDNTD